VKVGCIQRLWQKVGGQEVLLERDPVEDSVTIVTEKLEEITIQEISGRKVILAETLTEEAYVSYRPWLTMRLITFSLYTNEWGLKAGWRLELEEV
jgi:hypothetical protein